MIPAFNESGHLPVGGHYCTWQEFYERFRFNERREVLCTKLERVLAVARRCGFIRVMIGGSFPTAVDMPRDIDLSWITEPDVTKDTVSPECVKLMDDAIAKSEYGWNMLYLPLDRDEDRIQRWARELGFCFKSHKDRGMLVLDL